MNWAQDNGVWLVGWLGTWFVLSLLSEAPTTADLASALAISVALTATFVKGPEAITGLKALQLPGINTPVNRSSGGVI